MHTTHTLMHISHCCWQECRQESVVVIVRSTCPRDFGPAAPMPAHEVIVPIFREDLHLQHD